MRQPVNEKCSAHRRLIFERPFLTKRGRNVVNLDMCLVDLDEETLEFVEAYHKIAKFISTNNAIYGMFKL